MLCRNKASLADSKSNIVSGGGGGGGGNLEKVRGERCPRRYPKRAECLNTFVAHFSCTQDIRIHWGIFKQIDIPLACQCLYSAPQGGMACEWGHGQQSPQLMTVPSHMLLFALHF